MKMFLCIPMKDRAKEAIEADIKRLSEFARSQDYEPIYDEYVDPAVYDASGRVRGLARTIGKMAECDCVAFAGGWHITNGCLIIHYICGSYGIHMEFPDEPDFTGWSDEQLSNF